jgi:hypothetical protein
MHAELEGHHDEADRAARAAQIRQTMTDRLAAERAHDFTALYRCLEPLLPRYRGALSPGALFRPLARLPYLTLPLGGRWTVPVLRPETIQPAAPRRRAAPRGV